MRDGDGDDTVTLALSQEEKMVLLLQAAPKSLEKRGKYQEEAA